MNDSNASIYVELQYRTGDNYKSNYSVKLTSQTLSAEELKARLTTHMVDCMFIEPASLAPLKLPYPKDYDPTIDPTWFEVVAFHADDAVVADTVYLGEVGW